MRAIRLARSLPLAVAVLLLCCWAGSADARRVALVVGNDSYQNVTPLQNARADARAVAETLRQVGFSVTLKEDLTLRAMKEVLRGFKAEISGGDEAVFYFSGHGVQFGGANYLIPIDLVAQSEDQVMDESVPLQRVLDDLKEQRTRFALAIVDACRDNPFKGSGRAIGGRGLAPVMAATGQMILYSAGAGQEALDRLGPHDPSPNGLFTRVLIQEIKKPGVTADQVLRNVREQVVELARGANREQVPALYDQSLGQFYFLPPSALRPEVVNTDVAEIYARLGAARAADARHRIEQDLWERQRQVLPKTVFYADAVTKDPLPSGAAHPVWGFKAGSAASDGHSGTVTLVSGKFFEGRFDFDEADVWDYKVDCARQEFIPVRHSVSGDVTFLSEERRKRETLSFVSHQHPGEGLVEQVLCDAPLRLTPLWAVQSLDWTDLGLGYSAALKIRWNDPQRPNIRYVFARRELGKPDSDGSQLYFFWIGVNCSSHQARYTPAFAVLKSGEITRLLAEMDWEAADKHSEDANAYVLLCEGV